MRRRRRPRRRLIVSHHLLLPLLFVAVSSMQVESSLSLSLYPCCKDKTTERSLQNVGIHHPSSFIILRLTRSSFTVVSGLVPLDRNLWMSRGGCWFKYEEPRKVQRAVMLLASIIIIMRLWLWLVFEAFQGLCFFTVKEGHAHAFTSKPYLDMVEGSPVYESLWPEKKCSKEGSAFAQKDCLACCPPPPGW